MAGADELSATYSMGELCVQVPVKLVVDAKLLACILAGSSEADLGWRKQRKLLWVWCGSGAGAQ